MSSSESDDMRRMNRRQFVRNAGLAGVGLAGMGALAACGGSDSTSSSAAADTAAASSAAADVPAYQGVLKVLGIGVDQSDPIKAMYEKDHPGVTLEWTIKSTPETTQLVLTQPESCDIWSGYYHQIDQTWPSGNMQAIPTSAMMGFAGISPLITTGALAEGNNPDQPGRLVQWLYPRTPVFTWTVPGIWYDIGSKETLDEANRIFARR